MQFRAISTPLCFFWSWRFYFESFAFVDYIYLKAYDGISIPRCRRKNAKILVLLQARSKKPSKRKKLSNSFDKNRADVLAASDRGSHVEQEKLIALDEEEQSRWENEIVSSSPSKN